MINYKVGEIVYFLRGVEVYTSRVKTIINRYMKDNYEGKGYQLEHVDKTFKANEVFSTIAQMRNYITYKEENNLTLAKNRRNK